MTVVLTRGIIGTDAYLQLKHTLNLDLPRADSSSAVAPRHGRVAPRSTSYKGEQCTAAQSCARLGTDEPGTQSVELIDQLAHTIFAGCAGAPCGFGFVCDRCNQMVLMMLEHKVCCLTPGSYDGSVTWSLLTQLDLASARSKLPTSSRSQSRSAYTPP